MDFWKYIDAFMYMDVKGPINLGGAPVRMTPLRFSTRGGFPHSLKSLFGLIAVPGRPAEWLLRWLTDNAAPRFEFLLLLRWYGGAMTAAEFLAAVELAEPFVGQCKVRQPGRPEFFPHYVYQRCWKPGL